MQQKQMDFDRSTRLRLIDQLRADVLGLSACRAGKLRLLLRAMLTAAGDGQGGSVAKIATLASILEAHRRTVERWISEAERLGVLERRTRQLPGRGQVSNSYAIRWDRVEQLAEQTPQKRYGKMPGAPRQNAVPCGAAKCRTSKPNPKKQEKPGGPEWPPTWEGAMKALRSLGLAAVEPVANLAKGRGMTPQELQLLVMEFHRHRSAFRGPGALVFRIRNGRWPDAAGSDRPEPRSKATAATTDQRREYLDLRQQLTTAAARTDTLEARYGPKLDRMTRAELEALAVSQIELERFWRSPRGPARIPLLEALARKVAC